MKTMLIVMALLTTLCLYAVICLAAVYLKALWAINELQERYDERKEQADELQERYDALEVHANELRVELGVKLSGHTVEEIERLQVERGEVA